MLETRLYKRMPKYANITETEKIKLVRTQIEEKTTSQEKIIEMVVPGMRRRDAKSEMARQDNYEEI